MMAFQSTTLALSWIKWIEKNQLRSFLIRKKEIKQTRFLERYRLTIIGHRIKPPRKLALPLRQVSAWWATSLEELLVLLAMLEA